MKSTSARQSLLATALLCGVSIPAVAAPITWSTPSNVSADADVSTVGTLQYAYNLTNVNRTVNGVNFVGKNSATVFDDKVALTFASNTGGAYTATAAPFNNLSAAYKALLLGGDYRDAASPTAVTITLQNLTAGKTYGVQIWVSDPRAGATATRTESVTGGGGNTVTLDFNSTNAAGGVGQYTIGTFTADASIQAFTLTANSTQLNAIQVRETTVVNNIWSGETNGNWDDSAVNFSGQTFPVAASSNSVIFRDTAFSGSAVTNSNVSVQAAGVSTGTVILANTLAVPYIFTNASGVTGITGETSVSKTGAGTVTFAGGNTYTGLTTLNAGILVADHATALGSGDISFGGGTLFYGSGISTDLSAKIVNSLSPVRIDTNGNTVAYAEGISATNSGGLMKSGAGTLSLDGISAYLGNTTVSGGTLTFTGPDVADNSRVEVASGATLNLAYSDTDTIESLTFDGAIQAPGLWGAVGNSAASHHDARIIGTGLLAVTPLDVYWDGTGTSWEAASSWSASSTSATPDLFAAAGAASIARFSTSTVTTDQEIELDDEQETRGLAITNTTATTFLGGGTARSLTLGSSGISIAAGSGPVAIGSLIPADAVDVILAANQTWSNSSGITLTVENPIVLGSFSLTLTGLTPGFYSPVSGSGALVNKAVGAFSIPAGSSYTGGTVAGGVATGATPGNLTVEVTDDQSASNGGWAIDIENGTPTANTTVNFLGTSTVVVAAGKNITLGGTTGHFGARTLNAEGIVTNSGSLLVRRVGTVNVGGTWTQNGAAAVATQGGGVAVMNVGTGASFTYTSPTAFQINTSTSVGSSATSPNLSSVNLNGGTLSTGTNFHNTTATAAVNNFANVTLNDGGTLKLSADVASLATTAGGSFRFRVGETGDGGIIDTNGFSATLAVEVVDVIGHAGKLTKAGTGTLTLSGASSYTGSTTVTGGTLSLGQASLADASAVSIATNAVLNLTHGSADTIAALTLGGAAQGPGTYSNTSHPAFITGSGSLVIPGGADPYTSWIDSFTSLTTPAEKEKGADPDHDGLSNIAEFGLDADPSKGGASGKVVSKVATVSGDNYLTLTLPVRVGAVFSGSGPLLASKDGVTYAIGGSSSLSGFIDGVVEVTPALGSSLPEASGGWEYRSFRLAMPVTGAQKGFLKAEVTGAP